jgi:predicted kinase
LDEPLITFVRQELDFNFLLVLCGLPATGKTGVARMISRIKDYPILQSDLIRKEIIRTDDIFNGKVASDEQNRLRVYDLMFDRIDEVLEKHLGLILDATFFLQLLRVRAAGAAVTHQLPLIIIETVCPQEVAIRRIQGRNKINYESNALTEQAYFNNKGIFQPIDIRDIMRSYPDLNIIYLVVDTTRDSLEDWVVVKMQSAKGDD